MPRRRMRSGAIWAGTGLSAAAHAGLLALALVAPPWLRAPRERPLPVVSVALVTPAAFEAALARPPPAPPPPPAPAALPPPVVTPPPAAPAVAAAPSPPAEAEDPKAPEAPPSLAPAFDPEAPLGLFPSTEVADLPAHRPRARPGGPDPTAPDPTAPDPTAPDPTATTLRTDPPDQLAFEDAVRAAVLQRAVAPDGEEGGTARLALVVGRDGRLLAARLLAGSGSPLLDRVAIEAARSARLPPMPLAMPQARAVVDVEVSFQPPPTQ